MCWKMRPNPTHRWTHTGLCVSICPRTYLRSNLHQIFMHVTYMYGRGLAIPWRHIVTLCTSGFVDEVIFAHNGSWRPIDKVACCHEWRHCVVVRNNARAAMYWLRHVLNDGGRRSETSTSSKGRCLCLCMHLPMDRANNNNNNNEIYIVP